MALLVDGPPNTIHDLNEEDHVVLNLASIEKIDVASRLKRCHQEIVADLQDQLRRAGYRRSQLGLAMVDGVVADEAVKRLHLYRTLECLYRDAFMGSTSSAYKERMHEYAELARKAERRLHLEGVKLCASPLPRPEPPEVTLAAGIGPTGSFVVRTTLVNAQKEESAPSSEVIIENPTGRAIVVTPPSAKKQACGWVVYLGEIGHATFAQVEREIPLNQEWQSQQATLLNAREAGTGQDGSFTVRIIPFLNRG